MKKNLLKSLRVFCSGLLVAVMCLNLCVRVQAEENKEYVEQNKVSDIQELYKKIYSRDKCTMVITFTIVWDQTTEKISGNPRTPSIVADPNEGNYESLVVTSVQRNGTITNGGFSVQYTQISATLKGTNSLDDWGVDQYYNYSWSGNYTFTPANGLS